MSMPLGFNHVIYSNMLCTIFSLTDINFSLKKKNISNNEFNSSQKNPNVIILGTYWYNNRHA